MLITTVREQPLWHEHGPTTAVKLRSVLHRLGLARLLRLGAVTSIPPLWVELAVLHYRGRFQSPFMWIPVLSLPLILLGGIVSLLVGDERRSRALFRPFVWAMTAIGVAGTFFHLRGVGRQMGGYYNWKYNIITGPPFPAPGTVALTGLLAAIASRSPTSSETERLVGWVRLTNAANYVLYGTEIFYNHYGLGAFFNKIMYVPVILSPTLALVHLGALARIRAARVVEGPLSALAILVGMVGFGFHLWNVSKRSGGFVWQNFFYGPPVVAPLQMLLQGSVGLVGSIFGDKR